MPPVSAAVCQWEVAASAQENLASLGKRPEKMLVISALLPTGMSKSPGFTTTEV